MQRARAQQASAGSRNPRSPSRPALDAGGQGVVPSALGSVERVNRATLRTPIAADAPALGAVHLACWREAYTGLVSDAVLASFSLKERVASWRRIIAHAPNARYLAEVDGEVVGFSASGRSRLPESPRELELYSIYVLASQYGTGVGQQLIDAAVGDSPAIVWLADGNARAEAFYRKNGFERDGATSTFEPWGMPEIRMLR
jgi:GNAT superfamily N-acetyltransferase